MGTRPSKQFEETKRSASAIVWELIVIVKHLEKINIELETCPVTESSVLKGLNISESDSPTKYETSIANLATILLKILDKWNSFDKQEKSKITHVLDKYDKSKFLNANETEIENLACALEKYSQEEENK